LKTIFKRIIENKNQTKLKTNLNEIGNIIHQMKLKKIQSKLKTNSNRIQHKIQMELETKFK
jgi:hypothetical protein